MVVSLTDCFSFCADDYRIYYKEFEQLTSYSRRCKKSFKIQKKMKNDNQDNNNKTINMVVSLTDCFSDCTQALVIVFLRRIK